MKTAEEIIAYLEAEYAKALDIHEKAKGNNAQEAVTYLIKAISIQQLLEDIKK